MGTEQEYIDSPLDNTYGEVLIVEPNSDYRIGWQSTWACFWATQFYPLDTCITMGIDQVPLSNLFFDMVKECSYIYLFMFVCIYTFMYL
jgi:hypothetical protein